MGDPPRHPQAPPTVEHGHEHSDVRIRPLAVFLAALTGSLVAVAFICAWLFSVFLSDAERDDQSPAPRAEAGRPTPGPLLQVSSRDDLERLRRREATLLDSSAWVDRERGVARIPIDRAIELTVEKGLPQWPAAEVTPPAAEPEETPP
jgi:hypothetical protein